MRPALFHLLLLVCFVALSGCGGGDADKAEKEDKPTDNAQKSAGSEKTGSEKTKDSRNDVKKDRGLGVRSTRGQGRRRASEGTFDPNLRHRAALSPARPEPSLRVKNPLSGEELRLSRDGPPLGVDERERRETVTRKPNVWRGLDSVSAVLGGLVGGRTLRGTWKADVPGDMEMIWRITSGTIKMTVGDETRSCTYSVNYSKKPIWVDLKMDRRDAKCIVEFRGRNSFRITGEDDRDKPRPRTFEGAKDIIVFHRQ